MRVTRHVRPRQNAAASGLTAPRGPSHLGLPLREEPILCEVFYFAGALGLNQAALGGGDLKRGIFLESCTDMGKFFSKRKNVLYTS